MAQNDDKFTDAQLMEALGSAGLDIETITRLTHYMTAPGMEASDPDDLRKVRSIIILRLFKTIDAVKTADIEGKL